jgi:hypothetical protein
MPNTLLTDKFQTHLRRVETLAAAGIPAPKQWTELRQRFDAYRHLEAPACERLINVILAPAKTSDITTWHAQALAEQIGKDMPGIQARVDQRVAAAVEARLLELYRPHAETNYGKAAARFNDAAAAFTDTATAVDIDTTDANTVAAMPDDQRAAWSAAEQLCARLDAAVPTLTVAAELAGVTVDNETGSLLAMCVDTAGMRKRELWRAWDTKDGRCGRFGALVKLGAIIRAANLENIAPYERPRDVQYWREPEPGAPVGIYREVAWDPELPTGPDNRPPSQPEQTMIPGRRMFTR